VFAIAGCLIPIARIDFGGGARAIDVGRGGKHGDGGNVVPNCLFMPTQRFVDLTSLVISVNPRLDGDRGGEFGERALRIARSRKMAPRATLAAANLGFNRRAWSKSWRAASG